MADTTATSPASGTNLNSKRSTKPLPKRSTVSVRNRLTAVRLVLAASFVVGVLPQSPVAAQPDRRVLRDSARVVRIDACMALRVSVLINGQHKSFAVLSAMRRLPSARRLVVGCVVDRPPFNRATCKTWLSVSPLIEFQPAGFRQPGGHAGTSAATGQPVAGFAPAALRGSNQGSRLGDVYRRHQARASGQGPWAFYPERGPKKSGLLLLSASTVVSYKGGVGETTTAIHLARVTPRLFSRAPK